MMRFWTSFNPSNERKVQIMSVGYFDGVVVGKVSLEKV
jgi:hypothetical protein